jgi:Tol biopolymer transport system component
MTWRTLIPFLCAASVLAACTTHLDASGGTSPPVRSPARTVEGRIVLAGDDGEIHVLSLPEGASTAVTSIEGDQFDPDGHGRLVVFRDSRNGVNVDDEIYVVRSDGTRVRNLTNAPHSNEWGPAWSPDGTQIAFNSDREGIPQVYVMNADGTDLRRLSDVWGEYPAWSPDGDRIAFESYVGGTTAFGDPNYDVFVMNADGSGVANLTDDPDSDDGYPTWSPDGGWIAFDSNRATPEDFEPPDYDRERTSDSDIWVMRPDGSDLRNVTASIETLEQFPDWSDQGIVCTREGAIVVVSSDGSTELDVSEQTGIYGQFPAWVA